MISSRPFVGLALTAMIAITACGGSDTDTSGQSTDVPAAESAATAGIRIVSPEDAAATIAAPPADLVILDVRTPEEFDEGHLDGAVMLDFYRDDFAEALADFDPDVPYVLYCRSGNRSGQTRAMMADLGFTSVEDVDGGILNWVDAGLPVVGG